MGKSVAAAALLTRESKVPRKERNNGSLMVEEAPLFSGFDGEAVGMLVVVATEAEVVVRVVWGSSVPTVKVLDP